LVAPRLGLLTRVFSTAAAYDVCPPGHLNFFDVKSLGYLIQNNNIALSIKEFFQSHGPVFHIGHILCKHNYIIEDVIVEERYEIPGRVYPYRDNSVMTTAVCRIVDRLDQTLKRAIQLIDGQRIGHFILQAD
jgi:hypothetical protein